MGSPHAHQPADVDERLIRMRAQGFLFTAECDDSATIVNLVGVRAHHGVIDVVELYGPDDVLATRIPGDERNILCPHEVLWRTSGPAHDVLDRLLDLPDPMSGPGPEHAHGCWVPVGPGRLVWLAATDEV